MYDGRGSFLLIVTVHHCIHCVPVDCGSRRREEEKRKMKLTSSKEPYVTSKISIKRIIDVQQLDYQNHEIETIRISLILYRTRIFASQYIIGTIFYFPSPNRTCYIDGLPSICGYWSDSYGGGFRLWYGYVIHWMVRI
jgi:hypothetical protein